MKSTLKWEQGKAIPKIDYGRHKLIIMAIILG